MEKILAMNRRLYASRARKLAVRYCVYVISFIIHTPELPRSGRPPMHYYFVFFVVPTETNLEQGLEFKNL